MGVTSSVCVSSYTHRYRYSVDRVECHKDPTINKASSGKERTVRVCTVSENTVHGPLRARYMTVLGEIRSKMNSDQKTLLQSVAAEKKRLLLMVGGYDNAYLRNDNAYLRKHIYVDMLAGNSDVSESKRGCVSTVCSFYSNLISHFVTGSS